ncbi:hypothetical protein DSECCO2_474540 [anaerobic digester metagenome]
MQPPRAGEGEHALVAGHECEAHLLQDGLDEREACLRHAGHGQPGCIGCRGVRIGGFGLCRLLRPGSGERRRGLFGCGGRLRHGRSGRSRGRYTGLSLPGRSRLVCDGLDFRIRRNRHGDDRHWLGGFRGGGRGGFRRLLGLHGFLRGRCFGGSRVRGSAALDHGQDDFLAGAQGVGVGDRWVEFQKEVHVLAENQVRRHALVLQDFDQRVAGLDHVGPLFVGIGRGVRSWPGRGGRCGRDALGEADDLAGLEAAQVRDMGVQSLNAGHELLNLRARISLVLQDLEEPLALPDCVLLAGLGLDIDVLFKKKTKRFF